MADAAVGAVVTGKAAYPGDAAVEIGAMTLRTKSRSDQRRHRRRAVAERGDVIRYFLYVALAQVGLSTHERDCTNSAGDDGRGRGRRNGAADIRPDLSRGIIPMAERTAPRKQDRPVCRGLDLLDDRGMEIGPADCEGTMPDIRMPPLRHKNFSRLGPSPAVRQEEKDREDHIDKRSYR